MFDELWIKSVGYILYRCHTGSQWKSGSNQEFPQNFPEMLLNLIATLVNYSRSCL